MREKITTRTEEEFIPFSPQTKSILLEKRTYGKRFLKCLSKKGLPCCIYGSIARGDVSKTSDIDIIILYPVSSLVVELSLDEFRYESRNITQATPNHTPKAHICYPNELTVTFPLIPFRSREENFYHFAGSINLDELNKSILKSGVNKRLEFIKPEVRDNIDGYLISSLVGKEVEISKMLKIPLDVTKERIRVLTQRDKRGRTGIFLNRALSIDEQFEKVLETIKDENVSLRRFLQRRGY